ncbi:DUF3306 domain-containing protein [Enterovibrio sp. ZSDZ35]|uniref:DUF3306 domain-containing protein n=1 Tax=Enterovibrio qingdaonensis TaxID=2899818 RepID=A0ABT5QRB0_9GAMM|nr:DUF3306 domain-containing protein [Enterovibrio sp. ZSDZ35]MDD1783045.1 DUF3306 domain-containing protein [Enterovibrio sp. ZSDZ35]
MEDKPFLSRWSKRKLEPEPDEEDSLIAEVSEDALDAEGELNASEEDVETTEDVPELTMKDVGKLKDGDSAAAFLAKGISAEVKKAALRKLFQGEAYHVLDGMNDYDLDYSKAKNLTAEAAQALRHWTKDKLESVKEEALEKLQQEQETSPNAEQPADPMMQEENERIEDGTKSTHEEKGDILSDEVGQIVSPVQEEKNSDGS